MTTIRTVAAHEVVRATFPRPITEKDELGMAVGKAIDGALSEASYDFSIGRRPTKSGLQRAAAEILDRELLDAHLDLPAGERERQLAQIAGVLAAYRKSGLMGLTRPKSRLILIAEQVGIYAQPDFWDRTARIYEMKSYHPVPTPPDVRLQLELFQLAFPGFRTFLACFDRHATPVTASVEEIPPIAEGAARDVLRSAHLIGLAQGVEKVVEYIDSPTVRYPLPP